MYTGGGGTAFSNFSNHSQGISFVMAAMTEEFPLLRPLIINHGIRISFVVGMLHSIKKIIIQKKTDYGTDIQT